MSLTTMTPTIEGRFRLSEQATPSDPLNKEGEGDSRVDHRDDTSRVYRAEDLETGKAVAIKILIQASSKVSEFRSRFQRDADIMRSFDHPNVVKTIASGITPEGQPYLAMEYLHGQTLAARLAQRGPVPPDEMAGYLAQISSALDAAHARGIVHRDINPNAFMIQDDGVGPPVVKLLDFGLAKDLARPSAAQIELTSKQTSLGTAAYLSPEQSRGAEVDGRSDVYGLGVTLYEALTGQLPFEGETDFQILLAKINGRIPPFPEGWSDLTNSAAIEEVVLKALATNPADRPATAGALASLFQEALDATPRRKFPLSWPYLSAGALLITSVLLLAKWLL